MSEIRGLITLDEWNIRADRGEVQEPSVSPYLPNTGVECPGANHVGRGICRAHLWDSANDTNTPTGYQYVICSVCRWWGYRRKGRVGPKIRLV